MTEITSINDSRLATGNVCLIVSAPWCGQCKMMAPSFEKAASSTPGVLFLKGDVDKIQELGPKYGIKLLPTAVLMKDGEVVKTLRSGEINAKTISSFF